MVIESVRTTLRVEAAKEYHRVHSQIPEQIAAALREAGVVRWGIWRDGDTLFHVIETRDGVEAMERRMTAHGSIDPVWDALIATLVDTSGPAGRLDAVWAMTTQGQFAGDVVAVGWDASA